MRRLVIGLLALTGAAALVVLLAFVSAGISARREPSTVEAWAARRALNLLLPAAAARFENPLRATAENLVEAKEHFLDHCAGCHGEDGRGDTPIGRGLHPRAPDLTLPATQDLTDGELFWIVENGIKLTGMPAFGEESPDDDEHAWQQVLWIRRLPQERHGANKPPRQGAGRQEHERHAHSHRER